MLGSFARVHAIAGWAKPQAGQPSDRAKGSEKGKRKERKGGSKFTLKMPRDLRGTSSPSGVQIGALDSLVQVCVTRCLQDI